MVQELISKLNGKTDVDARMSKIAIRGVGMRTHTGVASKIFAALAAKDVRINLINTSELHITIAIDQSQAQLAHDSLKEAFGLT